MLARLGVAVVTVVVLSACSSSSPSVTEKPSRTPSPLPSGAVTGHPESPTARPTLTNPATTVPAFTPRPTLDPTELVTNRAKWETTGIANYQFDFTLGCFCGFTDMPIRIIVRNGVMESMTYASGTPVPPSYDCDTFTKYSTIELNLQYLDDEVHKPNHVASATFDSDYGFPSSIYTDIRFATDSGTYTTIETFEVLQ